METNIDRATLEELRAGLRGAAYVPGKGEYDEGRRGFNLNAHQRPAPGVMAAGAADVRFARHRGLGALATGHGVASPCDETP